MIAVCLILRSVFHIPGRHRGIYFAPALEGVTFPYGTCRRRDGTAIILSCFADHLVIGHKPDYILIDCVIANNVNIISWHYLRRAIPTVKGVTLLLRRFGFLNRVAYHYVLLAHHRAIGTEGGFGIHRLQRNGVVLQPEPGGTIQVKSGDIATLDSIFLHLTPLVVAALLRAKPQTINTVSKAIRQFTRKGVCPGKIGILAQAGEGLGAAKHQNPVIGIIGKHHLQRTGEISLRSIHYICSVKAQGACSRLAYRYLAGYKRGGVGCRIVFNINACDAAALCNFHIHTGAFGASVAFQGIGAGGHAAREGAVGGEAIAHAYIERHVRQGADDIGVVGRIYQGQPQRTRKVSDIAHPEVCYRHTQALALVHPYAGGAGHEALGLYRQLLVLHPIVWLYAHNGADVLRQSVGINAVIAEVGHHKVTVKVPAPAPVNIIVGVLAGIDLISMDYKHMAGIALGVSRHNHRALGLKLIGERLMPVGSSHILALDDSHVFVIAVILAHSGHHVSLKRAALHIVVHIGSHAAAIEQFGYGRHLLVTVAVGGIVVLHQVPLQGVATIVPALAEPVGFCGI